MKKIFMFLLLLSGIEVFNSCENKPALPTDKEYYYYPATNMYYDVAAKQYYFSLDGGIEWDSIAASANQDTGSLGDKKLVYAPDSIWKYNDVHRRAYGGRLLNIVDENDTTAPVDAVVTEKVVKKPAPAPEKEEKKKTGVGRFLQKIFGKKKKDKDSE